MRKHCARKHISPWLTLGSYSQAYYTEDNADGVKREDVGDPKGEAQDNAQHARPIIS